MDHRESADLDRHITGNYGEDQLEVIAEPPGLNDEREAERVAILAQADECSAAAAREGFMPGGFAAARSELDRLVRAALATPVAAQPEAVQAAARRLLDNDAPDIYAGDVRLVAEAVLTAPVPNLDDLVTEILARPGMMDLQGRVSMKKFAGAVLAAQHQGRTP